HPSDSGLLQGKGCRVLVRLDANQVLAHFCLYNNRRVLRFSMGVRLEARREDLFFAESPGASQVRPEPLAAGPEPVAGGTTRDKDVPSTVGRASQPQRRFELLDDLGPAHHDGSK